MKACPLFVGSGFMSDTEEKFIGFEPSNTTPVPDILFDELLAKLTGAELKVLLYIIRRTWGFKKQSDAISLSQLQHGIVTKEGKRLDCGCGIKRRQTIIEVLDSLENGEYIVSHHSKTSAGDNATTVYGIRFKSSSSVVGSTHLKPPVVSKPDHRSFKTGLRVVSKSDPQETVGQQTDLQETVNKRGNGQQNTNPTNTPSHSSSEQKFIECFTGLIEKYTPWKNYKVVPLTKSHKDYLVFQDLVNRNPSPEEMERVFLAFWNKQDKDKKYFWRTPETFKLNTFCRNYDAMLNAAIPLNANESHEKPSAQGMTRDNAVELEKAIVAKTQAHDYEVTTSIVEQEGVWVVKVLWGKRKLQFESIAQWREQFEIMHELLLEEKQDKQLQLA